MKTRVSPNCELLAQAQKLDPQALAQVYDLYSPAIYRYAMRLLGNAGQAEDCVAETFSRFLQSLHTGKGPREHLQAYLYRVAHNWITDQYRREVPEDELDEATPDDGDNPEQLTALHIRQAHLRQSIRQLTPDQQQVIALKYLEELGNEEIARIVDKPIGAVKSLQHRALASLQRLLKEKDAI